MSSTAFSSGLQLAAGIKRGDYSAVELLEYYLGRVER